MKNDFEEAIQVLGLSRNEAIVLSFLNQHNNPVSISKHCKIPRPTIYTILKKLEERGLIKERNHKNKKYWENVEKEKIEKKILSAHRYLTGVDSSLRNRIELNKRTNILIHRGDKEIINILLEMAKKHAGERIISMSGNKAGEVWEKVFKVDDINRANQQIKSYKLITELIASKKLFEDQIKIFGSEWARDFEGRAAVFHDIDNKYLNYTSQLFVFGEQIFLASVEDEIFIEIKNPEIAKLMSSIIQFIKDNSETMDGNAFLRDLIAKYENKKEV